MFWVLYKCINGVCDSYVARFFILPNCEEL